MVEALLKTVELPQLQFIDKLGVVQFLDKVVDLPVVCNVVKLIVVRQRHRSRGLRGGASARRGADRDVPVPQIEKFFVEVIQLVREVEQIVWHRAIDHVGNHEGDPARALRRRADRGVLVPQIMVKLWR